MALEENYAKLWFVLNSLILIYGIVILIVVKCCKTKKKTYNIVSQIYIL